LFTSRAKRGEQSSWAVIWFYLFVQVLLVGLLYASVVCEFGYIASWGNPKVLLAIWGNSVPI
jgi:hypothetical protein